MPIDKRTANWMFADTHFVMSIIIPNILITLHFPSEEWAFLFAGSAAGKLGTLLFPIYIIYWTLVFKKTYLFNKAYSRDSHNCNAPLATSNVNGAVEITLFLFLVLVDSKMLLLIIHVLCLANGKPSWNLQNEQWRRRYSPSQNQPKFRFNKLTTAFYRKYYNILTGGTYIKTLRNIPPKLRNLLWVTKWIMIVCSVLLVIGYTSHWFIQLYDWLCSNHFVPVSVNSWPRSFFILRLIVLLILKVILKV